MKKTLIIGSTVVDVTLFVDKLPSSEGDIHIQKQSLSCGGCAYNVSEVLRFNQLEMDLLSPIGTGIYGEYLLKHAVHENQSRLISQVDEENGCTYCFIEPHGERTFLSYHGAEYWFKADWFYSLNSLYDYIYVCGLELEEKSGPVILDYLEQQTQAKIIFACGPRVNEIPADRLQRILALHPFIHCNQKELSQLTQIESISSALVQLYKTNKNTIVVTCGKDGAMAYDGSIFTTSSATPTKIVSTNGAGDAHCGAFLSALMIDLPLQEALDYANRISSFIVGSRFSQIHSSLYEEIPILHNTKNNENA